VLSYWAVKPVGFEDLARLPLVEYYETAFRKATGVSLKLAPPEEPTRRLSFGASEREFCSLLAQTPAGCGGCLEAQVRAQRGARTKRSAMQINCVAGLTDVAVPILVDGQHVATLMSGQIFRREPTERDFRMVVKLLGEGQGEDWKKRVRKAYFETPVVTSDRLQAVIQLLNVFARYLADAGARQALASSHEEPSPVASAKQFVQSHVEDTITLAEVVRHVHLSRFYFCKLFKKATGMTLTEYVARVRVEKAKVLLVNPSLRISEVVFAAGFGSIPHFNSMFKRYVGMAPTDYRATLRSPSPF
jgi:AraC-like DNA-binding protein